MRLRLWPQRLLTRTGLTLALSFLLFVLFTLGVTFYWVLMPVGKRAADDLAALLVLSAQTWVELPPVTRDDFSAELQLHHGLSVTLEPVATQLTTLTPYLKLLEVALKQRLGESVLLREQIGRADRFWVALPMGDYRLHFGFNHQRIGASPLRAIIAVLMVGALFTVLVSLLLVHHLARPLERLSRASRRVGEGKMPDPLPLEGPEELQLLTGSFNRMALQVRELLANRTTLLAGISHDLRTPLARLRLSIEMLPQDADDFLLKGIGNDIEQMDRLISEALLLARDLEAQPLESVRVAELLETLVEEFSRQQRTIEWQPHAELKCRLAPLAFKRVVANLLENALRYGGDQPPELSCRHSANGLCIRIADRGPGIPEEQLEKVFQPFYRLEGSRNRHTGGSGLGLAIAKQLCDAQGWCLSLQARPGGGLLAQLSLSC